MGSRGQKRIEKRKEGALTKELGLKPCRTAMQLALAGLARWLLCYTLTGIDQIVGSPARGNLSRSENKGSQISQDFVVHPGRGYRSASIAGIRAIVAAGIPLVLHQGLKGISGWSGTAQVLQREGNVGSRQSGTAHMTIQTGGLKTIFAVRELLWGKGEGMPCGI
jgi:hypothetical protein